MIVIPASLTSTDRWLLYVISGDRKIPFDPNTLWPANRPDACASFEFVTDCLANTHAYPDWEPPVQGPPFDGAGFRLDHDIDAPFAVIDLDDCRNPETGEIEPWALSIVKQMNSFTEVSRSGEGLHIFCKTQHPPTGGCRKDRIEIYSQGRWIAVTGDHLLGTPTDLEDRTAELLALHEEVFGSPKIVVEPTPTPIVACALSDSQVLNLARTAANGKRFRQLFDGPVPPGDHSRHDYELVAKLLFWFGHDFERVDRVFRQSALMRAKWLRVDYRLKTMRNAAARVTEQYRPALEKEVLVGAGN